MYVFNHKNYRPLVIAIIKRDKIDDEEHKKVSLAEFIVS